MKWDIPKDANKYYNRNQAIKLVKPKIIKGICTKTKNCLQTILAEFCTAKCMFYTLSKTFQPPKSLTAVQSRSPVLTMTLRSWKLRARISCISISKGVRLNSVGRVLKGCSCTFFSFTPCRSSFISCTHRRAWEANGHSGEVKTLSLKH